MIALRYVYVVALAIWVGGLITVGSVVAPSAFAVLEPEHIAAQQSLAATLIGEVLRRFHLVGYAAGALLLSTLLLMKVVGPRPTGFGVRLVMVTAMLAVSLVTGLWVNPQIASMRASVGMPMGSWRPTMRAG